MRLHVFNPEHDIALAHDTPYLTPPRAAREMRHDLSHLPTLWANDGDKILTDDPSQAQADQRMCQTTDLSYLPITEVCPWGWDSALVHRLEKAGISRTLMPSDERLARIRQLSSRQFAATILPQLIATHPTMLVGEMQTAHTLAQTESCLAQTPCVLKEPWSSSGRGVRTVGAPLSDAEKGWIKHTLERQGSIMVEPLYERVADLGMEFTADGEGINYAGLSLFDTRHGAYTGNIVASEAEKQNLLENIVRQNAPSPIIPLQPLLKDVREAIRHLLTPHLQGTYTGPLGVDMMLVRTEGTLRLHPMVEINLRRTMGHVAISLYERGHHGQMTITRLNGHHTLIVSQSTDTPCQAAQASDPQPWPSNCAP